MSLINVGPNEKQIMIMNNIFFTIKEIYHAFFCNEFSDDPNIIIKSSKNLIDFSKDFDILPYIMNEMQIMTYYKLVIHYEQPYQFFENDKNRGVLFTLNHFMLFIVHLSLYSFAKKYENITEDIIDNSFTNESKLLLLLEKLEYSNGMKNFRRIILRPTSRKLSLIPSKEIYYKVGELTSKGKFKKNKIIKKLLNNESY